MCVLVTRSNSKVFYIHCVKDKKAKKDKKKIKEKEDQEGKETEEASKEEGSDKKEKETKKVAGENYFYIVMSLEK